MEDMSTLEKSIHLIRGKRVILDRDLALLYGVQTRELLQAVKRNLDRFPQDFVFVLTDQELTNLRSQTVISRSDWGGRRTLPYAFTEHGVAMLASVLNSQTAIKVSVLIIRSFVRLRELVRSNEIIEKRVEDLEQRSTEHTKAIVSIIEALDEKSAEDEKRKIGFSIEGKK